MRQPPGQASRKLVSIPVLDFEAWEPEAIAPTPDATPRRRAGTEELSSNQVEGFRSALAMRVRKAVDSAFQLPLQVPLALLDFVPLMLGSVGGQERVGDRVRPD